MNEPGDPSAKPAAPEPAKVVMRTSGDVWSAAVGKAGTANAMHAMQQVANRRYNLACPQQETKVSPHSLAQDAGPRASPDEGGDRPQPNIPLPRLACAVASMNRR